MNWKEEYINKFCTFEGENRMVFKNKITADESLNFIEQIISKRDGLWRLALTHLPTEQRESVLKTLDELQTPNKHDKERNKQFRRTSPIKNGTNTT